MLRFRSNFLALIFLFSSGGLLFKDCWGVLCLSLVMLRSYLCFVHVSIHVILLCHHITSFSLSLSLFFGGV